MTSAKCQIALWCEQSDTLSAETVTSNSHRPVKPMLLSIGFIEQKQYLEIRERYHLCAENHIQNTFLNVSPIDTTIKATFSEGLSVIANSGLYAKNVDQKVFLNSISNLSISEIW